MAKNFHESYASGEVNPPSERATGLVFAAAALIVALLWHKEPVSWWALSIALILATASLIVPRFLRPLNILWFKFGLLLHRIVNPVVMFALFIFVFVPAGALMRIWYDPLRLRRQPEAPTYWIDRTSQGDSMANQF